MRAFQRRFCCCALAVLSSSLLAFGPLSSVELRPTYSPTSRDCRVALQAITVPTFVQSLMQRPCRLYGYDVLRVDTAGLPAVSQDAGCKFWLAVVAEENLCAASWTANGIVTAAILFVLELPEVNFSIEKARLFSRQLDPLVIQQVGTGDMERRDLGDEMTDVLSVLAIEDGDAEYCMAMNGLLLGYAWDAYDSAEEVLREFSIADVASLSTRTRALERLRMPAVQVFLRSRSRLPRSDVGVQPFLRKAHPTALEQPQQDALT